MSIQRAEICYITCKITDGADIGEFNFSSLLFMICLLSGAKSGLENTDNDEPSFALYLMVRNKYFNCNR